MVVISYEKKMIRAPFSINFSCFFIFCVYWKANLWSNVDAVTFNNFCFLLKNLEQFKVFEGSNRFLFVTIYIN